MTSTDETSDSTHRVWQWAPQILLGTCIVAVIVFCLAPALGRAREAAKRAECATNLKKLGVAFKAYATDHKANFPSIDRSSKGLLFDRDSLFPQYLADYSLLTCPTDAAAQEVLKSVPTDQRSGAAAYDHSSYVYLGYMIENEKQGLELIEGLKMLILNDEPFPENITICSGCGVGGKNTLPALKEGVERFIITDINCPAGSSKAQSVVPIAFDHTDNHMPGGINVLFMDGHVEFKKVSEEPWSFPATKKFLAAVDELVKLRNAHAH